MERETIKKYLNAIKDVALPDENNNFYIDEVDFDDLFITKEDRENALYVLKEYNIPIKKQVTKRSDRSPLVRDMHYGDYQAYDMLDRDETVMSEVKINQNGEIIFENFDELRKFLDDYFIPANVTMKVKRKKEDPTRSEHPFIQLNKITKLRLSELEVKYVMNYLSTQGITVRGIDSTIDQNDFDNYDYYRTYRTQKLPDVMSYEKTIEKIDEYRECTDPIAKKKIKDEIILGHSRLVPYVASKYAKMNKIDIEEFESYGYEGLIKVIDKFDASKGCKFSTFAISYIRGNIKSAVGEIVSNYQHRSSWTSSYATAKRIVEEVKGRTLIEDPKLAYDITKLMIANGSIRECDEKDNITRINLIISESLDELQDKEIDDSEDYNSSQFESSRITRDFYSDNPVLDEMERKELRPIIEEVLATLTPREADVMKLRYGFVDGECWSLKRIGKHYGVTQERIRQIEAKAIRKLRHIARIKKIIDYKNSSYDSYNSELPSVIDDIKKL